MTRRERIALVSEGVGWLMTVYLLASVPFPPAGPQVVVSLVLGIVLLCGIGLIVTVLRRSPRAVGFGLVLVLYCGGVLIIRGRQVASGLGPILTGPLDHATAAAAYSNLLAIVPLFGHGFAGGLVLSLAARRREVAA